MTTNQLAFFGTGRTGRELVKLLKAVIDLAVVEFSETALRARKD